MIPVMHRADDPDEITARLTENGAVIIEDFLAPEAVAAINAELGPVVDADDPTTREFINPFIADFFGTKVKHVTGLASRSTTFIDDVLLHPIYEQTCERILGLNCAEWTLNIGHLLQRGPGAEQQYVHRDQDVWNFLPKPHPEVQVASIVALTDFTADNGATRLVPASNHWDDDRYPTDDELIVAEMPAGAAVLYLGSTFHAGGTNCTADEWRRGFHLSFVVGWLRTEENNVLATPPDVARTLPLRAQELIGYKAHDAIATGGGYLGVVDVRHPTDLLATGEL
ncbi:MAG: phytanoyl-CoA dioxygenase family protein [Acidimicrobiales bacterium]|jgi:ectoine hydroxylase-related dioxygenase (phytanoyl-CoA dioxygenase family)|nr:phytanoyl-CoA dioxygenase family protein [Acidimicrobiales bacterium]